MRRLAIGVDPVSARPGGAADPVQQGARDLGATPLGQVIELRRGKAVATVALARKLAGTLFPMMRNRKPLDPGRQAIVATKVAV